MGVLKALYRFRLLYASGLLYTPSMSKLVAIRIPDELAAMIYKRAKDESMTQTAVIVNGLWAALCPVDTAGFQEAMDARKYRGAQVCPNRKPKAQIIPTSDTMALASNAAAKRIRKAALGRTPKKIFGPSRLEAVLPTLIAMEKCLSQKPLVAHAPGCKCLMCAQK